MADLGPHPVYIATSEVRDAEMADRVALHRDRRGPEWNLIEEPFDLVGALGQANGPVLVDCLTLWLTNLMLADRDWQQAGAALAQVIPTLPHPVIFVTNEVGAGIVPENALARRFRDAAGTLNQTIADTVDEVYLCVAGQPLKVKPHAI